jgi:ligand-binding sensor domain-containing protein/signal transduction histidine kinase
MTNLRLVSNVLTRLLVIIIGNELVCRAVAQPFEADARVQALLTQTNHLRPPVHPRRNVENFPAVPAKFIRLKVFKTNLGEPCVDELEVFPETEPTLNVALATAGARATASGTLPGYQIHQVAWVNDGLYGNGHSWVADRIDGAWVQIELPKAQRINRVIWSRDREGFFMDRLAIDYCIEVSTNGIGWQTVASSADRVSPIMRDAAVRWSPMVHSVNRAESVHSIVTPEVGDVSSDYHIDRWQTEDGLPDNTVTAILQARDGYLWIGTLGGLVRFDGVKFKRYSALEGLMNERVLCLYEDLEGKLWVGTEGGGLFRFENGRFMALTTRDGLSSDVVMDIVEDDKKQFWIGTYAGLDCWRDGRFVSNISIASRPISLVFKKSSMAGVSSQPWRQPPTNAAPVSRVAFDSQGALWNVVDGRLFQMKEGVCVMPDLDGEPSGQNSIPTLRSGRSGRLWFGGISGYVAALSNNVVTIYPNPVNLSPDSIIDICEARNGDVWAGTSSSGLRRWRDGKVLLLTTEEGMADNSVRCMMEDREGNLWVGTSHGGLNRLKPKKLRLVTTSDGLSDNVVMSLAEGLDGVVWIGSNGGGINVRRGGTFTPSNLSYLLDNESISSLLVSHNGDLWIGTWSSGLICKTREQVKQFSIMRQWDDEPVLALCEDSAGRLWVGTYQDGLKCFQNGKYTSYRTTNGLSANYITTLTQDRKGRLWIGTGGSGLNSYIDGNFRALTRKDGLASDFVRSLYVDHEDVLWIGTSAGLSRLKDGQLTAFTTQQGLWDDVISQILEDDSGHLWFGSSRGIFRVSKDDLNAVAERHKSTIQSLVFGKEEGMENLECTGGFCPAGLKTRDGFLWFSTVKGVAIVDPKSILVNTVAPPVVLDEVRVSGHKIDIGLIGADESGSIRPTSSPNNPKPLRIAAGARRVEFQFTALSFTAPEKVRFRYRLDGLDTDWVEAEGNRVAEYPYLPPGKYRFRVTACNEDGVWNDIGAVLAFTCLPAFWQTVWFRSLTAFLLLGGTAWSMKILTTHRMHQRLLVLQQQHALEKERTRIARDIHDELGTLLTEISLLSDHGQNCRTQPGEVEIDLRRISDTAREAVQTADGIVWAVNPRNDSLDHLANYLVHFVEDFFRLTSIRCRLDVPAELPPIPLSTQHRHHILLVVKEACNNIVRHSLAPEVWLRMSVTDNQLSILVEDNGKGFLVKSVPAESNGLVNMRQRMADLGGRLELSSSPGQGTCVKLIMFLNHFK